MIGLLNENEPIIVDLTKNVASFISRTVIDNDKFNSQVGFTEDFSNQTNAGFSGVVSRDNDADIDSIFILSYDFLSLSSLRRLIVIILLSLISSSISNKHSSQNSLSSESLCSRTLLFLLQRAHLFIFPRLCDLVIWGTWKMGVASLS